MKMEHIKCSETSAFNNQTPGKYPKDYTLNMNMVYDVIPPSLPPLSLGLLTVEVSKSHSDTQKSVGILRMTDRPVAQTSNRQHTRLRRDRNPCRSPGFLPAIPASERPRTHTLGRAVTGIWGYLGCTNFKSGTWQI